MLVSLALSWSVAAFAASPESPTEFRDDLQQDLQAWIDTVPVAHPVLQDAAPDVQAAKQHIANREWLLAMIDIENARGDIVDDFRDGDVTLDVHEAALVDLNAVFNELRLLNARRTNVGQQGAFDDGSDDQQVAEQVSGALSLGHQHALMVLNALGFDGEPADAGAEVQTFGIPTTLVGPYATSVYQGQVSNQRWEVHVTFSERAHPRTGIGSGLVISVNRLANGEYRIWCDNRLGAIQGQFWPTSVNNSVCAT